MMAMKFKLGFTTQQQSQKFTEMDKKSPDHFWSGLCNWNVLMDVSG
jgi:hypothetical protein